MTLTVKRDWVSIALEVALIALTDILAWSLVVTR